MVFPHLDKLLAKIPRAFMTVYTRERPPTDDEFALLTSFSTEAISKAEKTAARTGVPLQHVQARHKQVASEAHEIVEQALLEQGIDAYKYVEG